MYYVGDGFECIGNKLLFIVVIRKKVEKWMNKTENDQTKIIHSFEIKTFEYTKNETCSIICICNSFWVGSHRKRINLYKRECVKIKKKTKKKHIIMSIDEHICTYFEHLLYPTKCN